MTKRLMLVPAVCGAIAGAIGIPALAQTGGSRTPAPATAESTVESTAPENSAADRDNVQYTAPGDPDYKGAAGSAAVAHKVQARRPRHRSAHPVVSRRTRHAARTTQAGEQPGETSTENESSVEAEAGQPGEPANGHADAPGQDTQCEGNCVQ